MILIGEINFFHAMFHLIFNYNNYLINVENFIGSLGVLIRFFLYLDPLHVKCSEQFVQFFFKIATKK